MKKISWFVFALCGVMMLSGSAWATNYGVFVGLNQYSSSYIDSSSWLDGCVPDANHVYTNALLRGDWTASTVSRLLNSAGSKTAIRQAISNYAATAVSGDVFWYYHSSHGGQNSGKSVYLCTYNDDYQDTELATDLATFATGVKVIVVVDACHSGGLFQSKDAAAARALTPETWDLAGNVTRIMDEDRAAALAAGVKDVDTRVSSSEIGWITAADYDEYSWDGDDGGLFTSEFIEGWTNPVASSCDLNGDSYANFYELYDYSWDVANNSEYEYTQAQAYNTNVLLNTLAGWIGDEEPGGAVAFSNLTAQTVVVGQTLNYPVGAYTVGATNTATVTMTTVLTGASYSGGQLTFTPTADGSYSFNFTATNALEGSASTSLTVTATLPAPASIWASATNNTDFTASWSAVSGASSYRLDVATNATFSVAGGSSGTLIDEDFSDFSDWTDSGTANDTSHYGDSSPCRALGTGDSLTSPAVDYPTQIAFYVDSSSGGNGQTTTNYYSLDGGSTWLPIGTFTVTTAGATETQDLTSSPDLSGETNVMFRFVSAFYTWYLDDVVVTGGAGSSPSYVPGYQDRTVAGTSQSVTGLTAGTTYYFRSRAVGNATGANSPTASVMTVTVDTAPAFNELGAQAATVDEAMDFTVGATGYPVPVLALQGTTASSGYSFTAATGLLDYTPPEADLGEQTFTFTASNSMGVATQVVSVTVSAAPVTVPTASIANLSSNSFTVNWTAITGGSTYQVQVATDNVFAADSGGNLMSNGGFETGDSTDWDKFETEYEVVSTDPEEGSYHVSCTATGTRDLMQAVDITGDGVTEYEVSFWYKKPLTNGNARIWASWATGGQTSGDSLQPTTYLSAASDWTKVTYVVVPNSGDNTLNFEVRTYTGATVLWDNFFVGVSSGTRDGAKAILVDDTVSALTYDVTGLEPETLYYARVRGTDGTWSEIVSATTTAGGSTPTPPDPEPITALVSPTNGTLSLEIPTQVGTTYAMECSSNLVESPVTWIQVGDSVAGTGSNVVFEDTAPPEVKCYYRIVAP